MTDGERLPTMLERVPAFGRTEPRLATPHVGSGSYARGVTQFALERMPNEPMGWNNLAWELVLAHDDAGRLCHRQALVSVARQNSKTTWAEALVGWRLTEYAREHGPQTVLWVCHDLRLSEQVFIFLGRVLEAQVAYRSNSFGRQRMVLQDGSTFAIASNTAAAGHGWSPDLCIVDECWKVKPEAVNHGLMPAMRARPQPQIILASTAGDENSELLKLWRERGLSIIEAGLPGALAMLEWSMPPDVDWHDPQWWAWPNPCLGTTVTPETLLAEYQGPDRGAFLRGSLNVWTSTADGWLPVGQWDGCRSTEPRDPKGGVVACEVSQSGERFYAVRAWQHNGVTWCAPFIVTEHEDELWSALDDALGQLERVAITPTLEAHLPPSMARKHTVVGMKELAKNVPLVRSMIAGGQVAHGPSPMLDEHVGRAVATRTAGLSTAHSSGSIELARCLVWAVTLSSRPSGSRRPAMGTAREN